MDSISKNKHLIVITLLFVLGLFAYRMFSSSTSTEDVASASAIGSDLLRISEQLSQAQLSQNLFNIPGYKYLTDFTAPLPQQPLGRSNPFGNIGQ